MGFIHTLKGKLLRNVKGVTESDWLVDVNDERIQTIDFQKKINVVQIKDISSVEVETNDSGPWGVDLWWKIEGAGNVIWIPNGATGELDMQKKLMDFDGFKLDELTDALRSTANQSFVLWSSNKQKQFC